MNDNKVIDFLSKQQAQETAPQQPPIPMNPRKRLEMIRLQLVSQYQYVKPLAEDPYFSKQKGMIDKPTEFTDKEGNPVMKEITCEEALQEIKIALEDNFKELELLTGAGLILPK